MMSGRSEFLSKLDERDIFSILMSLKEIAESNDGKRKSFVLSMLEILVRDLKIEKDEETVSDADEDNTDSGGAGEEGFKRLKQHISEHCEQIHSLNEQLQQLIRETKGHFDAMWPRVTEVERRVGGIRPGNPVLDAVFSRLCALGRKAHDK